MKPSALSTGDGKAFLSTTHQVGIIGCGHLGETLAEVLLARGFPQENLRVSYGGNPVTLENIKKAGLFEYIAGNEEICQKSDIILITIKPQDLKILQTMTFSRRATVVSCMAGISSGTLKSILGVNAVRIMTSGPDTIRQRKGIVALFPAQPGVRDILSFIGFKIFEITREDLLHPFTAGVCLPAALLVAQKRNLAVDQAMLAMEKECPGFQDIYKWALDVLPRFTTDEAREAYIRKMTTKGGITEVIVESIHAGEDFLTALFKGISRSKEIAGQTD
jgi:pyrroline-5-carboxylate reductase